MFISNQRPNHSLIDSLEWKLTHVCFEREESEIEYYDIDLLKYVQAAIKANHNKLFIVLHSYGSHYNYNERYEKVKGYIFLITRAKPNMRIKVPDECIR